MDPNTHYKIDITQVTFKKQKLFITSKILAKIQIILYCGNISERQINKFNVKVTRPSLFYSQLKIMFKQNNIKIAIIIKNNKI